MVACQYRTAETIGHGTFSVVKRAVHVSTLAPCACKIIDKKTIRGREKMIRNEIVILEKTGKAHPSILGLQDYFETNNHVYLCFDLCAGGTLTNPIRTKTSYNEGDAVRLVSEIARGVDYLHGLSIVHRDLKPDNVFFLTHEQDSRIVIGDFGFSQVLSDSRPRLFERCGTIAYMAPELFQNTGYGASVDIWALGVFAFYLISGDFPFGWKSEKECFAAIIKSDYKFKRSEVWDRVSQRAKSFINDCLVFCADNRPVARQLLQHDWLTTSAPSSLGEYEDLLPYVKKQFNSMLQTPLLPYDVPTAAAGIEAAAIRGVNGLLEAHTDLSKQAGRVHKGSVIFTETCLS